MVDRSRQITEDKALDMKKLAGVTLEASILIKVILEEAVKDVMKTARAKQAIVTAIQRDIEKNRHSRVLNALGPHIKLDY